MRSDPEMWTSEQLILCRDDAVGLRAVIAIDDTTLGPGLGGVRFRAYPDDAAGIRECRRLAAAMTLKNAVAELPFGGAKSVIFAGGDVPDRVALMRRFGTFVARAGGAYLPGVDMGTTVADLGEVERAGATVSCADEDPSPATAVGVHHAIHAAVAFTDGRDDLAGARVLVQGAGHVGTALARLLAADGAELLVADVDGARAEALAREVGGAVVAPEAVVETPCDVFAPCAVARMLDRDSAERLGCRIVAGAANDTHADRATVDRLAAREIVYVPDFVANAGGVLNIHALRAGWSGERLDGELARIGERVGEILAESQARGTTPLAAAELRATRRLAAARAAAAAARTAVAA